jgi:hypothetical protein
MNKLTIASFKNNHKQYEIVKIKSAADMFHQEIEQYHRIYSKFDQLTLNLLNALSVFL